MMALPQSVDSEWKKGYLTMIPEDFPCLLLFWRILEVSSVHRNKLENGKGAGYFDGLILWKWVMEVHGPNFDGSKAQRSGFGLFCPWAESGYEKMWELSLTMKYSFEVELEIIMAEDGACQVAMPNAEELNRLAKNLPDVSDFLLGTEAIALAVPGV
ncbi:hypothetical protein Drorol1_Dr00008591 [Drosera rotundifolia]